MLGTGEESSSYHNEVGRDRIYNKLRGQGRTWEKKRPSGDDRARVKTGARSRQATGQEGKTGQGVKTGQEERQAEREWHAKRGGQASRTDRPTTSEKSGRGKKGPH